MDEDTNLQDSNESNEHTVKVDASTTCPEKENSKKEKRNLSEMLVKDSFLITEETQIESAAPEITAELTTEEQMTEKVGARQQYELAVQKLMDLIISDPGRALLNIRNGTCDVHWRDFRGFTALHHSAASGDLGTVKALVDFGCHPSPVSLAGRTPSDLAIERGHTQVQDFLTQKSLQLTQMDWIRRSQSYYNLLLNISSTGIKRDGKSDINVQAKMFKVIKGISSELSHGTPLTPPGSLSTELTSMTVECHYNNSCRILEQLLSVGATIYQTTYGRQSILQIAWLTPTNTTKEAVIITREMEMRLVFELQKITNKDSTNSTLINITEDLLKQLGADNCLKEELKILLPDEYEQVHKDDAYSGYRSLISRIQDSKSNENMRTLNELSDKYAKIKIWRAAIQVEKSYVGPRQYNHLSHLVVRTCELGLTCITWWLWRSRINMNIPDKDGRVPLLTAVNGALSKIAQEAQGQAALVNFHWETAKALVRHMGANPFLKAPSGDVPFKLMPQWLQQEMLQHMVMKEYIVLEGQTIKTKNHMEKLKMRKLGIFLSCLYVAYKESNPDQNPAPLWKALYMKSLPVLLKVNEEQFKGDDRLDWLKKFTDMLKGKDPSMADEISLPELVSCLQSMVNSTCILEEIRSLQESNDNKSSDQIQDIISEALEICCERAFPLFLHLLIDFVGQDANAILDDMLNTKLVHRAAANGESGVLVYLHYTCEVPLDVTDKNKNNPAHLAFLNGNTDAGNLLLHMKPELSRMENTSGRTPLQLEKAYKNRIWKAEELLRNEEYGSKAKELCKDTYDQTNEEDLAKKHMEILNLKKESKRTTFRELAMALAVDFETNEAKIITQRVIKIVIELVNGVGERNPLLRGKPIPLGSSSDNVRLVAPDEFDINILLYLKGITLSIKDISHHELMLRGNDIMKKLTLTSESNELKHLLDEDNNLDEFKLLGAYFSELKAYIASVIDSYTNSNLTIVGVRKTGGGVGLTLAWMGEEYPLLLIDVDLVPVIQVPFPAELAQPPLIEHLTKENNEIAHEIKLGGETWTFSLQDVIAAYISGDGNGYWRFSTGLVENFYMLKMSEKQREVYLITKYIMSAFKSEDWYTKYMKDRFSYYSTKYHNLPTPTGFILKIAFFNEIEQVQEDALWQEKWYLQRIRSVFLRMTMETDYQKKLLYNMITDTKINVVKGENDFLIIGKPRSYFAPEIERKSRGFMAHIMYKLLEGSDINDFVVQPSM